MTTMTLSSAERVAIVVAAIALLLQAIGAVDALELRRALWMQQPWRLLTGHLVHLNWLHALVNAAALFIVARLFARDLDATRQGVVMALSAIVIGIGLSTAYRGIDWYRGLSGVIHALFFAGAAAWLVSERSPDLRKVWLPAALLVGGWIKVLFEQPRGDLLPHAEWLGAAVVPQAHLIGAACGTTLGLLFALANRRRGQQRAEQQ
jgi:rhomboid family GlyGly-CTERM serine protease